MNVEQTAVLVAFGLCAFLALAGALGMATTMSMFRSGIFLMASFIGVGGLFILLAADLMGLLQIMMYIGGMLVMILFMVLFMHDPGGSMMAGMPDMMSPIERFFSRGLQPEPEPDEKADDDTGSSLKEDAGHDAMNRDEMDHADKAAGHGSHGGMDHAHMDHGSTSCGDMDKMGDMGGMDMDMSMVTPVRPVAAWGAAAIGIGLFALLLLRPDWPVAGQHPNPDSARAVGMMLMHKYMIAFEGAGFLILLGIFGAVFLARTNQHAEAPGRALPVARPEDPPPAESGPAPGHEEGKWS
ncbi:hypothetical protein AB595_19600 [Massilia sp. WF1]|uniref:NADH-quinone oxidoreductase subunit J family protein n=1 Tax=unclassified Massilia TaxID=2609279 RepID=UPI00064AC143|nr:MULTISPECIES: NADH-quinone oxidoreductase subunit J [unclassified Massilia]ALK97747.1 hypothetical protein AM586_17580 [Massilia sp. WG5]KLU35197.1 hypothetical protein AB595_19600 [Massilia sp. WF1]